MPLLVVCSLVTCLTNEPVAAAAQNQPAQLRVLTYNLLHDGPWSGFFENGTHLEERLDMTIQELRRLQPDIIALQEASDSRKYGNVPKRIAGALGYHIVFAPATERIFGIGRLDRLIISVLGFKEGPAILSRYPIVASEIYDLPRCRDRHTRWAGPGLFGPYLERRRMPTSSSWGTVQGTSRNRTSHLDGRLEYR